MRNRFLLMLLPILMLFASACSQNGRLYRSAQKHYSRANFDAAVRDASRSLRLKPDNAKAQELIVQAWEQSIKYHEENVNILMQSSDSNKWELILQEYTTLQELSRNIQSLPPLVNPATGYRIMLSAPDVTQKINESKSNAAEAYYQAGIRFSKMSNSMDIQKKAALEFAAALKLIPDYKDAYLKFEQSRNLAVKRIAVV
ncbi:MAG: hypothetical protein PHO32_05300, partial [Candidatus Cloacimonetes bacterium]|nr:hypothetical protein [Candidatus Cloacimonadota bacterium]